MNNQALSLSGSFLVFSLLSPLVFVPLRAAPLLLDSPVILSNHVVELNLAGQAGASYSIEASLNLSNWFLVSTGIATNGLLRIQHDGATNYPMLFYRGKGTNSSILLPSVVLNADTNISVSTLLSLDGGSCVLYGWDGTRFTLTLPTNSIPDPHIITLTLVTNISGLPFARGTLGAVVIEPADLVFWGAASLEITFPTNLDRREVISFFSNGDGSSFHLTPDRVGVGQVVIPVSQAGAFGSSLCTTQELANATSQVTGSVTAPQLAKPRKSNGIRPRGNSTSECFPDKQLAADEAKRQIDAARDAKSNEIAVQLGVERHNQLAGESDDSSAILAQVVAELCAFYTSQIAPRWTDAANNCALGQVLIQNTLGLERQRELLGATDDCTALSNIPFCAIFESCLDDTRQCCANGNRGPARVTEVLGLQRQDQLLGLNCISQSEADGVIDLCSSNAWTGSFSMNAAGGVTTSTTLQGTVNTTVNDYKADFTGYVSESVEAGDPVAGIDLTITGPLSLHTLYKKTSTYGPFPCSSGNTQSTIRLQESDGLIATNTVYKLSVELFSDNTYTLSVINFEADHPEGNPWGTDTIIAYSRLTACDGSDVVNDVTQKSPSWQSGRGFNLLFADRISMTSSNTISGSYSVKDSLDIGVPVQYSFNWNFTRHVVTP